MNKKMLKYSLLPLTVLSLFGCGPSRSVQETEVEDTEVVEEVEAEEEEVEEEVVEEEVVVEVGKRSNPVLMGESVTFTETYYGEDLTESYEALFELKVTDILRGEEAFATLLEENQFNEPAPEGMEWAIITLEGTLHEGDEDVPYTVLPWFSVIDSSGSEVSQDEYATLDGNEFGYVDLFPGGQTSGRITQYMPIDDPSLLVLEAMLSNGIYFSLSQ